MLRPQQSKMMSFIETVTSTAVGFIVALLTQMVTFPIFDLHPSMTDNLLLTGIFTIVSILRGFVMRRVFEVVHSRGHHGET